MGKWEPTARVRQQRGEAFPSSAASDPHCSRYPNPTPLCSAPGCLSWAAPFALGAELWGQAHCTALTHPWSPREPSQKQRLEKRGEERSSTGDACSSQIPPRCCCKAPAALRSLETSQGWHWQCHRKARDGTHDDTVLADVDVGADLGCVDNAVLFYEDVVTDVEREKSHPVTGELFVQVFAGRAEQPATRPETWTGGISQLQPDQQRDTTETGLCSLARAWPKRATGRRCE